jgi:hypothetical protein
MADIIPFDELKPAKQIERYTEAIRTLKALPAHVKKEHWNMGDWGSDTECGTVACAAGHCGVDQWFIRRGLKLHVKVGKRLEINDNFSRDANDFFGNAGMDRVFTGRGDRPVAVVVEELKRHVEIMRLEAKSGEIKKEMGWDDYY